MVQKFTTNLNCGSCVAAVTPYLDRDKAIERWSVDTEDPRKVLTVEGADISKEAIQQHVANFGFRVLGKLEEAAADSAENTSILTYRPLFLILAYLVGLVALAEISAGSFQGMRAMRHFMGGFFLAFSFFKLLDVRGFADAFQTYDILARGSRAYGYAYPFIELALGIAFITSFQPVATNAVTLAITGIGTLGVTQALVQKRRIKCACLGSVFNLPMSKVTFFEDTLMAGMAAAMLAVLLL